LPQVASETTIALRAWIGIDYNWGLKPEEGRVASTQESR
jgi:hypothetical protein